MRIESRLWIGAKQPQQISLKQHTIYIFKTRGLINLCTLHKYYTLLKLSQIKRINKLPPLTTYFTYKNFILPQDIAKPNSMQTLLLTKPLILWVFICLAYDITPLKFNFVYEINLIRSSCRSVIWKMVKIALCNII